MKIGIISAINPVELKEFLYEGQKLPDTQVSASSVHALIAGLVKLGHHVTVIGPASTRSLGGWHKCSLSGSGLKIVLVPVIPKIDFMVSPFYLPQSMARVIKGEFNNLDVIHSQWTYECAAATLAFSNMLPTFCSVRDWWPVQNKYFKNSHFINRTKWGWSKKIMFNKVFADNRIHFVANSQYTKSQILSLYPQYEVPIVENPINGRYILENKPFVFNNVFVSISYSLLEKRKNIYTLLRAFMLYRKNHEDAKLLLVGGCPRDSELYENWKKEGLLQNVELLGRLKHDEVIRAIDRASVLIHPSLEETYGNILLEAMARRALVIGGKSSGAVPSVLGDGKYGFLCDVSNYESVLSAMEGIYECPARYNSIVDSASNHLKEDLSDEAIAKKYLKLYHSYL